MDREQLEAWYEAAEYHQQCLDGYGVTGTCERGCPCERAEQAYAAAIDLEEDEIGEWIEAHYPLVTVDLGVV